MNEISGTELVIFEQPYTALQLFSPGAADPLLDRIKQAVKAEITDPTTPAGRKRIISLAMKVTKTKTAIEAARLALVADEKKRLSAIDAEGRRIRLELDALADEVRQPVTEFEDREKSRIAAHEAAIQEIRNCATFAVLSPSSQEIEGRIAFLSEPDGRDWQEFSAAAKTTRADTIAILSERLQSARKAEAERAELERLRREAAEREQREREEAAAARARAEAEAQARRREEEAARAAEAERQRIQREAEEREAAIKAEAQAKERAAAEELARVEREKAEAKAAAEKAERDRAEAARLAEEARIAAEEDARRREAQAAENERLRIEAEKKAEAEATRKREADKAHRAKINNEALSDLMAAGIDEDTGRKVIKVIALGQIAHIYVAY